MKLFLTFTKKSLAALLAAVTAGILILGQVATLRAGGITAATNAERVQAILQLGYEVEETPEDIRDIVIPEVFSEVYAKYNQLQTRAGFDLSGYKGKKATVYTYRMAKEDGKVVNLIVCGDRVIGGDVSEVQLDGEMLPLGRERKVGNGAGTLR